MTKEKQYDGLLRVEPKKIDAFFDKAVLPHLNLIPSQEATNLVDRAKMLIIKYAGRQEDCISVIGYAAEKGKLSEYLNQLDTFEKDELGYMHPDSRGNDRCPQGKKTALFFIKLYQSLGIKPQN